MFDQLTGIQRQGLICSCLYIGQILVGYSGVWAGPCLPKLRDLEQSPLPYVPTEAQLSLVATLTYIGAVPGPYITTWLSNIRGRKPCLVIGAVASLVSYTILGTARNLAMLYISRILNGIVCGTIIVSNLVYIGEIASPKIRGALLTGVGIFTTVGSLFIYAIAPYVSYHGTVYIGLAFTVLYIATLLWIPETPIFYALKGRDEHLQRILDQLGRSEELDTTLKMKSNLIEVNTKKEWIELFSLNSNRKALTIVTAINILQQSSGVVAVLFFSSTIFKMAELSLDYNLAMIIILCFQLLGGILSSIFVESLGRRKLLLISTAICFLSMFVLGWYFYLDLIKSPAVKSVKWLPLLILVIFYIGYHSGFGVIPNTISGEMFTTNVRSKGSTISLTVSYVFGFTVNTMFGAFLEVVGGHMAFWFFACTCALAFLFTAFFIPETKGKTLLEIQESL